MLRMPEVVHEGHLSGDRIDLLHHHHAPIADASLIGFELQRAESDILVAVLLTSLIFALGGFLNALFAKNFDQVNWIPTFVLTPLTYFGGVFYSISLLPDWARRLSYANPILHMVSAFRYGFLGTSDVNLGVAFAFMVVAAAALFALAVKLLDRGTGIRD